MPLLVGEHDTSVWRQVEEVIQRLEKCWEGRRVVSHIAHQDEIRGVGNDILGQCFVFPIEHACRGYHYERRVLFRFFPQMTISVYVASNEGKRRREVCGVDAENWQRVGVGRRPAVVLVLRGFLRQKERKRN